MESVGGKSSSTVKWHRSNSFWFCQKGFLHVLHNIWIDAFSLNLMPDAWCLMPVEERERRCPLWGFSFFFLMASDELDRHVPTLQHTSALSTLYLSVCLSWSSIEQWTTRETNRERYINILLLTFLSLSLSWFLYLSCSFLFSCHFLCLCSCLCVCLCSCSCLVLDLVSVFVFVIVLISVFVFVLVLVVVFA